MNNVNKIINSNIAFYDCNKDLENDINNKSLNFADLKSIYVYTNIAGIEVYQKFRDFKNIANQLNIYKNILRYIKEEENTLKTLCRLAEKMGVTKKIYIHLDEICDPNEHHFGARFLKDENLYDIIPACFGIDTIYIFANRKNYKKRVYRKNIKGSLFHEFGHFIESTLYIKYEDKYSNLVKKDFKIARLNTKNINHMEFKDYYKHVSPPTSFKKFPKKTENTYSSELFAEILTCTLLKKHSIRGSETIGKIIKMFPHTNYAVKQFLKGKLVNKYKSFEKNR